MTQTEKLYTDIDTCQNPHEFVREQLEVSRIQREVQKEGRKIESLHQLFISREL